MKSCTQTVSGSEHTQVANTTNTTTTTTTTTTIRHSR